MRYVNVRASFLKHNQPEFESIIRESLRLLETMINSEMFMQFVLNGKFIENNAEVYEKLMSKDISMTIEVVHRNKFNRHYSVDLDTNIIKANFPVAKNINIERHAAILLHEYGHIIGLEHPREIWGNTFLFYVQQEGEKLFRKFKKKLKDYPRKGYWLTYEPVCTLLWFWKKIKFNKI